MQPNFWRTICGGMVKRRLSPTRMPSTPRSQPLRAAWSNSLREWHQKDIRGIASLALMFLGVRPLDP